MTARLTGAHPILLRYTDGRDNDHVISVGRDGVVIEGIVYPAWMLKGLAALASGDHTMFECVWADCPEHACPFTHSHTSDWCGRPTCRTS